MTSDERSPFVSVVIPTWDRAEFVSTCLGSLVEQDYPADRFEVIVVADGSTDGTQQVVDEIAAATRPPAIRFISKPHGGSNSARNLGIASSAGELICLVDDDQVAPKGWLTSMIAGVGMFPDAGCFGGPMRLRLEGRPPRACGREQLGESELDLGEEAVETEHVWGGNMTLRRAAFETAGPFREDLVQGGEETEWQDRARERGIKIVYLPEPFVWHRRTAEQL
ncbi:MAG: hypothetical protein QOK47_1489, partial [Actinomycetota bacterium]|nr:hypothetical protein [Actinomycetota bacterium]